MKQNTDDGNLTEDTVFWEEFDTSRKAHEFSREYCKNKNKMLRRYQRSVYVPDRAKVMKAAAVLILFLAMPTLAAAASGSEFFARLWGTAGKKNVEAHTEEVRDEEKGIAYTVTYPRRNYTNDNLDRAEELIGEAVSYEPAVKEIGDARLMVLAAVCDGDAAVVEFTLEQEGGIECFQYSQLTNESKGAWFSEDSPFYFQIAEGNESIFVDLDKSTEEKLYCYDYIVTNFTDEEIKGLTFEIYRFSDKGTDKEAEETDTLFVPVRKRAEKKEYVNQAGGVVSLSPIAMKIDMNAVTGIGEEEAGDPWHVYYAAVKYRDGNEYIVHEHAIDGVHQCDADIDNTGYACARTGGDFVLVFNRLTDIDKVESVVVNETVYMPK